MTAMTDRSNGATVPRRRSAGAGRAAAAPAINGGWWKTLKLSTAMFLAVFALIALQLTFGRDPMLGTGRAGKEAERATVHRKLIVLRKVIIETQPAAPPAAPAGSGGTSVSQYSGTSAAAPAAAPTPMPAPAPAPAPTTSAS